MFFNLINLRNKSLSLLCFLLLYLFEPKQTKTRETKKSSSQIKINKIFVYFFVEILYSIKNIKFPREISS